MVRNRLEMNSARLFLSKHAPPGPRDRLWVELPVTQADIDRGVMAAKPGLMLFTGMWYGDDPLDIHSYGKMIPTQHAKAVGRIGRKPAISLLRKLGYSRGWRKTEYRCRAAMRAYGRGETA